MSGFLLPTIIGTVLIIVIIFIIMKFASGFTRHDVAKGKDYVISVIGKKIKGLKKEEATVEKDIRKVVMKVAGLCAGLVNVLQTHQVKLIEQSTKENTLGLSEQKIQEIVSNSDQMRRLFMEMYANHDKFKEEVKDYNQILALWTPTWNIISEMVQKGYEDQDLEAGIIQIQEAARDITIHLEYMNKEIHEQMRIKREEMEAEKREAKALSEDAAKRQLEINTLN